VAEAYGILGVSAEAVRGRIRRGSLKSARDGGTVSVSLPSDQSTDQTPQADDQTRDRTRDVFLVFLDARIELLERMVGLSQERLEWLEAEVEWRAEAEERLHQLLAGLIWANATRAARVPELEPAREVQYPRRLGRQGGPAQYIGERQAATERPS
jgi:hypothetical protein